MQYLKIPKERVKILIGRDGIVKRDIEKRTKTKILIDEGEIAVEGEPIGEWIAKDIVRAIGRGFNPEKALRLLNDKNTLEIISLEDFCKTEKALKRMKGRIIGENGKCWRIIEELTGAYLSVYGKTVSIIGRYEEVEVAREAINKILDGAPHSTVYRFLERNVHSLREKKMGFL